MSSVDSKSLQCYFFFNLLLWVLLCYVSFVQDISLKQSTDSDSLIDKSIAEPFHVAVELYVPEGGDKIILAESGRNSLSATDVSRDDPLIAADSSCPPLNHTQVLSEQEDSETSVDEYEHDYDYEHEHDDEQEH